MKKIVLVFLTFFLSINSNAGNWYIGPSLAFADNTADHTSYRGVNPKLSLGYGTFYTPHIYLGTELNASFNTLTLSSTTANNAENIKITNSYAAGILPGVKLSDETLAFLRLGVVNSYFNSVKTRSSGGQVGFGLQTYFFDDWDVRGEFIYTGYNSLSGIHSPESSTFVLSFIHSFF